MRLARLTVGQEDSGFQVPREVKSWNRSGEQTIQIAIDPPLLIPPKHELVESLLEKVVAFLKSNKIRRSELPVSVLEEELLFVDSGGESAVSIFRVDLFDVDRTLKLYFSLDRPDNDPTNDTTIGNCFNYVKRVDSKFLAKARAAINDAIGNGSYVLCERANARKAFHQFEVRRRLNEREKN